MGKIPVIFDCDPGHDDAIALIVALASDILDIKAITCVSGNSSVENTTQNALKILELCGATNIPVAMGASRSMLSEPILGSKVHGESGMDGPQLPHPTTKASDLKAWELIAQIAEESDEPISLIVTGPATNIGIFLLSYPHLKDKIKIISFMGGGHLLGNRTAVAEFNVLYDPESVQIMLQSGIPVEMYGLDVTHKAQIYKEEFHLFKEQNNKISIFVGELLAFFSIYYTGDAKLSGCPMHDACAVIGLINPRIFTYEQCSMEVDLVGKATRGAVAVDLRTEPSRKQPYNGSFALDVNRKELLHLILESCKIISKRSDNE